MTQYLAPAPYAIEPERPGLGRRIIAEVAERHGLTAAHLIGRQLIRAVVLARQEAMWELRQRTKLSTPQIGHLLGDRDHSTVLHGAKAHRARAAHG